MTIEEATTPATGGTRRSTVTLVVVVAVAAIALAGGIALLASRNGGGAEVGSQGGSDPAAGPAVSTEIPTGGCPEAAVPAPASLPDDDIAARTEATSAALVGCPEADGTTKAEAAGWTVRVVVRDGETQLGTMDYRVDRVGLTVDGGVITGVQVG
jgi:hypothetical protein